MSSNIFHENLSFTESSKTLLFFFCLSNISSKFCFDEFNTTSFDLKIFFIKLIELGNTEKIKIIMKLVNSVLKKLI